MAKARQKHRPAKQPRKTKVDSGSASPPVATRESVLELAEKAAERIRKVAPLEPSEAERAERAARAEARKTIGRYIAVANGQVPPPWAKPTTAVATSEPAITKEALAQQRIQALYGCHPYMIPKKETKTGTVKAKVNAELEQRDRYSWDTINRALGRDRRRK